MIKSILPNLYGVESVLIKAILPSKLNGPRLLVQLPNGKYSFLIPPKYEIAQILNEVTLTAAIAKHGYMPIEENFTISNEEQLNDFIKDINDRKSSAIAAAA